MPRYTNINEWTAEAIVVKLIEHLETLSEKESR